MTAASRRPAQGMGLGAAHVPASPVGVGAGSGQWAGRDLGVAAGAALGGEAKRMKR
jgi:hypothetical protein